MKRYMAILLFAVVLFPILTVADVPGLFSYQGILKDSEGQPVEDDVYAIQFRIYDAETEGAVLWESEGFIPIQTADGLLQHVLGSTNPIPDSLSRYSNLWVGITIDLDEELVPRTKLVSVPFSINAQYSDSAGTSLDKTIDAGELTEGTLDVERFSAYEDLAAEEKIGEASDQVAAGEHVHGWYYLYRRIGHDSTIDSIQSMSYVQVGNTISIPPAAVVSFIRINVFVGYGVEADMGKCYLDIRVGQDGNEESKDEHLLIQKQGNAFMRALNMISFYYEPTPEEKNNGFNIEIFMKTSYFLDWSIYKRCDVFGI